MKVFHDEDATRLAVSTVPPITTSFCKEPNVADKVKLPPQLALNISSYHSVGQCPHWGYQVLENVHLGGLLEAELEWAGEGGKKAREQIESGAVFIWDRVRTSTCRVNQPLDEIHVMTRSFGPLTQRPATYLYCHRRWGTKPARRIDRRRLCAM